MSKMNKPLAITLVSVIGLIITILFFFIVLGYVSTPESIILFVMFVQFLVYLTFTGAIEERIYLVKHRVIYFEYDRFKYLTKNPYPNDQKIATYLLILRLNLILFIILLILFLKLHF